MARSELIVDLFAGLTSAGGVGRYVRNLVVALSALPGAPPARFAYPRDLREPARALLGPERLHEIPRPWWQLRLLYGAATVLGTRFDRLFGDPAVFHSPAGYGPVFSEAH